MHRISSISNQPSFFVPPSIRLPLPQTENIERLTNQNERQEPPTLIGTILRQLEDDHPTDVTKEALEEATKRAEEAESALEEVTKRAEEAESTLEEAIKRAEKAESALEESQEDFVHINNTELQISSDISTDCAGVDQLQSS